MCIFWWLGYGEFCTLGQCGGVYLGIASACVYQVPRSPTIYVLLIMLSCGIALRQLHSSIFRVYSLSNSEIDMLVDVFTMLWLFVVLCLLCHCSFTCVCVCVLWECLSAVWVCCGDVSAWVLCECLCVVWVRVCIVRVWVRLSSVWMLACCESVLRVLRGSACVLWECLRVVLCCCTVLVLCCDGCTVL